MIIIVLIDFIWSHMSSGSWLTSFSRHSFQCYVSWWQQYLLFMFLCFTCE